MNNDFNFKQNPSQTDSANSSTTDKTVPTESQSAPEEQSVSESTQPKVTGIVTSKKSPGKIRRFFAFLGLLLLLALVAGGVWYWQQMQIKDLTTAKTGLESQVATLQAKAATKDKTATLANPTVPAASLDIITVSPTAVTPADALASVQYTGKATELWVESGTQADKLTTVSKKVVASAESDVENFKLTGLKPATRYYYRAAGTVDGKTVYGGVIMFISSK